jgi:hypothetical protein
MKIYKSIIITIKIIYYYIKIIILKNIKKLILVNFPYKKHTILIGDETEIIIDYSLNVKNIPNCSFNKLFIGNYRFYKNVNCIRVYNLNLGNCKSSFVNCINIKSCINFNNVKKFKLREKKLYFWSKR